VGHCERFLSHMKRHEAASSPSQGWKIRAGPEKRLRLLKQVRERDVLGAPAATGRAGPAECRAALDAYAEAVFLHTK